jgi:hypothetical protein
VTRSALIAATALGLALAGCAGKSTPGSEVSGAASSPAPSSADSDAPSGAASAALAACSQQQTAPHPELLSRLPAGFPTVAGWQPTTVTDQGLTREVSGVLRGEVGDLLSVRDSAADTLVGAGYQRTGSDAEPGYEAEADLKGPHDVAIKVRPLCRDYLVLSYTVRQ